MLRLRRQIVAAGPALLLAYAVASRGEAHAAAPRTGEPELFAPGVICTGDDEAHATFTADGRRVYFLKDAPNFMHWTIVFSDREGDGWAEPAVAPFSGRYGDGDLSFSPTGDTAYFISTRPTKPGAPPRPDTEIWRMGRTPGGALGEPEHVAELSSDGNEWFPNATADGWLYFGSERPEGNLGPAGTSDLWRARLVDGRYGRPENLGPRINTEGEDIEPWISADGRLLIFSSKGRSDTHGSYDLYASRLCDGAWTEPRNLGDRVNSSAWEFGARPTPDGRWLMFTSNRGYTDQPLDRALDYADLLKKIRSPGNGLRDIYRVEMSSLPLPRCVEDATGR